MANEFIENTTLHHDLDDLVLKGSRPVIAAEGFLVAEHHGFHQILSMISGTFYEVDSILALLASHKPAIQFGLLSLLLSGCGGEPAPAAKARVLLDASFDAEPRENGWKLLNWSFEENTDDGWLDGKIQVSEGLFWRSPLFQVAPFDYYRIEFRARGGKGPWVGGLGVNPAATWGRYPSDRAIDGQLVADDWTSFEQNAEWTQHTFFSRARANATLSAVRFMGDGVAFDDVRITTASREAVAKWSDQIYTHQLPQQEIALPSGRLALLPRTREKLASGGTLRMVFLGDSIMNDSGNSTLDVLIERRHPGTRVELVTAVGGGTGADKWNDDENHQHPGHDLDLNRAVIDPQPDIILLGGISNGPTWAEDLPKLVRTIRTRVLEAHGYTVDLLLLTGAFGSGADPKGYAEGLQAIAASEETAFLDLRRVSEAFFSQAAASGIDRRRFHRDDLHANALGKQVVGRILEAFFRTEP